ncbi:MAG: YicC family protein, partial [Bacteroidales bacterium]|nr:YicC family protein [Bacteroidales bacterium]
MIQSMTGYGRSVFNRGGQKILVEIRSVNGKNSDISVKSQLIPREKEAELKQIIAAKTIRGTVDLFAAADSQNGILPKRINGEVFRSFYDQIMEINHSLGKESLNGDITGIILRLPDVVENVKPDDEESWPALLTAIENALDDLLIFRKNEGSRLASEISGRVELIEGYLAEVDKYEAGRIESVRERITKRMEELAIAYSTERLEQELVFYIEKLDITEEKVRLSQHCKYFRETILKEEYPGRKLGFIAQEMGREINTLGSKANNVDIQKIVVNMKDELEKIKEQVLNI